MLLKFFLKIFYLIKSVCYCTSISCGFWFDRILISEALFTFGLRYFAKRNETKRNGTLRNGTLRNGTLRNGTLRNEVKTCKRWQAAHLHRREAFETFYILLYWGDLSQGILQFKIWTMISLLHSGPKIQLGTVYVQQGKIVWVEQNLLNVQQTIYSVRAYSCWICSPFMRYVYSKI